MGYANRLAVLAAVLTGVGASAQVLTPNAPSNLLVEGGTTIPGPGLPSGVTLRHIDGGPNYYRDHGFTYAANAGWDDPSFFPIGPFLEKYRDSTDAAKWRELGFNTAVSVQGDANLSLMQSNGVFLIIQADEWLNNNGNGLYRATLRDNVVGINAFDEPSTLAQAFGAIQAFPNAQQDGRFWYENYTHNQVTHFDVGGVEMDELLTRNLTTPNGTTRQIDLPGVDVYFFNGANAGPWPSSAGAIYRLGRSMTADEMRRGIRYRDIVHFMRNGSPAHGHPAFKANTPMSVYVETGTSYNENSTESSAIRSAEINAAVWGSIIGGARMVKYFTLGDGGSWNAGGLIGSNFWRTPRNGDTISNYDQVAATNALVTSLAEVINSPFATGYATVSPPPVMMTTTVPDSGFEMMVKYRNRGTSADNKFYLFVIPRYGSAMRNQTATFTLHTQCGSSRVTVINENRTIPVTNCQFQDSFATNNTVHIYRVD